MWSWREEHNQPYSNKYFDDEEVVENNNLDKIYRLYAKECKKPHQLYFILTFNIFFLGLCHLNGLLEWLLQTMGQNSKLPHGVTFKC